MKMTISPSVRPASLPSFRVCSPRARPINANTRHATGNENFWWRYITGPRAVPPLARSAAITFWRSAMYISGRPRSRLPVPKTESAGIWTRSGSVVSETS